ncbi:hypothetical protein O3P69_002852 [Scylla paramamosain]|uniref:Treslin N-terminal domain-containing protein n=1 Tax=Scylla paramamosain TaxID=85552 RepID=A0AAW0UMV2_SCYPA
MYSTVQAVLVLDLSNFVSLCSSESEIEHHIAKIKLVSLKLLLNFGAKTERAVEGVRWSWKFYDSRTFRPDTSRRQFLDLGRKAFGEFETELTDKYCKAFDNQQEGCEQSGCRRPHSFVLKKALQEVLLDYNWDGPDISSPVKTTRRKNGSVGQAPPPSSGGTYNAVVVVANVPRDSEGPCEGSPEDFFANVLDAAMVKAFQEDRKISLSLIDLWEAANCPLPSRLNTELAKLSGSLHSITDFIQTQPRQVARTQGSSAATPECGQNGAAVSSQQVQLPWRSARTSRPRKAQPGPTLMWEDVTGISHLSIQLQVLAVYGSCSRAWGSAAVVGVVHTSQVALLALAQETASLYMCVAAGETFGAIVTVLATHQLSLVLQLSGGSLALLSPWGEGAGCLALVSASGLAALAPDMPDCPPSTLQFVSAAVRKCLKNAAPHAEQESSSSNRWFSASMVQCWFRPIPYPALPSLHARNKLAPHRRAMLERLQKKYRPQIPQPLATGETGPLDLVDITQPPGESQPSQATLAKPTMTRAQQLLKKSHIVTAQQRVKEQLAEEEERVQATERRAAQACERALKSQALETQILNTVSDPQDERELVQSLMDLRETAGVEADIFTTAQTIINLALVHIKNTTVTATPAAATMQEGLDRVLGYGVLQSAAEILHRPQQETHLHQYKLQTLLHLELLWVLGYSACSKQSEGREEEEEEEVSKRKEHHVEEVIKLLRAISLHHDPSTMAKFLQEIVLENYLETLGDVLLEVYEELNQPLPPPLRDIAGDLQSIQSNWLPPSVKSQGSPTQYSESPTGSGENPGSSRSREGRRQRLRPHPSLQEANKRSIVVPKVTRAISRTLSEQVRSSAGQPFSSSASGAAAECSGAPVKNVCRNLFELGETSLASAKSHLQKSHTQPGQNTTPKKPSLLVSKVRQPPHITPVKKFTFRSTTPRFKAGNRLLIPETPENKVGSTVFNHNRCHKSMGTTCIGESPDIKMSCHELSKSTPRRLRASLTAARRNSFYSGASGARSRNWERARTQLLADHIKGHADRRPSDTGSQQPSVNAGFLFSNILSASPFLSPSAQVKSAQQTSKQTMTPDKNILAPNLNISVGNDSEKKDDNSITTKLTIGSPPGSVCAGAELQNEKGLAASMDLGHTPVKRVRRVLLLSTPSKAYLGTSSSPERDSSTPGSTATDFSGFSTPTKKSLPSVDREHVSGVTQAPAISMLTQLHDTKCAEVLHTTQNKKVQFTLKLSPNTPQTPKRTGTPKSILKTPNKTPLKSSYHSPLISSKHAGSWRREDTAVTPCKRGPEEDVYPSNPVVKVGNLVSHSEHELELLSPSKTVRQPLDSMHRSPSLSKYPKMSLRLGNSPRKSSRSPEKSKNSLSKLNANPGTFFSSDRKLAKRLETAGTDCIVECDNTDRIAEVDVSLLPDMPIEDINLVSSLLFGTVEVPDLEIPVLELCEDSYLLEHPANVDTFEVCDSDDGDDALLSPKLPDLEATVALHSNTDALDFGCMSPILLSTQREWYNHRADSGGGIAQFTTEVRDIETNSAVHDVTPKEVVLCQDVQDVSNYTDSTHDVTEASGPEYNVTKYSGSSHGAVGSSCDATGDTDSSHVSEDINILVDVAVDVDSSQLVAENCSSLQHAGEEAGTLQYVEEGTTSSQGVDEDTGSSQGVDDSVSSQGVDEDTGSSQSVDEATSSSQGVGEDIALSQSVDEGTISTLDVDEDTALSQSVDEGTGSSQSVDEGTSSTQGVGEDTVSSQSMDEGTNSSQSVDEGTTRGMGEDTALSQSVDKGTGSTQGVGEDSASSQGVGEDSASSQDADEDTGSLQSVHGDTSTSQGVGEDTALSQSVDESTSSTLGEDDSGSFQCVDKESGSSESMAKSKKSSQGVDEDTNSSQSADEGTSSSQGTDGGTDSSQGMDDGTVSSQSVDEGTGPLNTKAESCSSLQNVAQDAGFCDVPEDTGSSQNMAELGDSSQTVAEDKASFHCVVEGVSLNGDAAHKGFSYCRTKTTNTISALNANEATDELFMTEDGHAVLDTAGDSCVDANSEDAKSMSFVKQSDNPSLTFGARDDGSSSAKEEDYPTYSKSGLITVSSKLDKQLLEPPVKVKVVRKAPRVKYNEESLYKSPKMASPTHKRAVKARQKGKRSISTNSEEEPNQTVNQENVSRRRVLRKRIRRQAAVQACRKLADSVQEISSDDGESHGWHQQNLKKRIFDDILTPEKINVGETTLPLKNVENLPYTPNKPGYGDNVAKDAESIPASNVQNTGEPSDTVESFVEQEHNFTVVNDFSEKLCKQSDSPSLQSTSLPSAGTAGTNRRQPGKQRKKSKGVKLTLTRSGDQYQVTKTQISRASSDPNSSGDLDLNLSCSDLNDNLDSSKSSAPGSSGKISKKRESFTLLTPHRFTRHMSRDISLSPDVYQQLITLSPQRLSKKPKVDSEVNKGKNCNNTMGQPMYASTPRDPEKSEEWIVRNRSDSPSTKTFVRTQKRKHQIIATPRVKLPRVQRASPTCQQGKQEAESTEDWSPLFLRKNRTNYSNPSIQSLLHLSSDKILLDQSLNHRRKDSPNKKQQNLMPEESSASPSSNNVKLRSSRRLLYSSTAK